MSFDIPVWCCSQIFFCFVLRLSGSLYFRLKAASLGRSSSSSSLAACFQFNVKNHEIIFIYFSFGRHFFCTPRTTCWCLAQLFTRHNVKMKFSKFVHLLLFFFLKAAHRVRKHERNTCRVLPPRPCSQSLCCNRFMNFWFIKVNFVDQSCVFFFLKKQRKHVRCFMITNAALMRSRCGLHVASRI